MDFTKFKAELRATAAQRLEQYRGEILECTQRIEKLLVYKAECQGKLNEFLERLEWIDGLPE
jgi:hypothetical protein